MTKCDCCDSVLEHKVRELLAMWEYAPINNRMSARTIINELEDAIQEYDELAKERSVQQARLRELSAQKRAHTG